MTEELRQQLVLVEEELQQVQEQIACLLERQEKLLGQKDELQNLLDVCEISGASKETTIHNNLTDASEEDWAGSFPWDKEAHDCLLNIFGIPSYRTNQREIVNAVMSGKDVVVIMAAGGGKSLCYQLPAVLRPGITLIISPLLSLIQDQIMGLNSLGILAASLTSVTSKDEEKTVYTYLEKGEGQLKVLYVTPEKISKSKRFMSKLEKCNHAGRLSLIAIDEAHCCSQWGHDFRPDYKNLGILKKQFPKVPMIALTATATARVQADLREMLLIKKCVKFVSTVNRPNLFYEVREKSSNSQMVISEIAEFIKQSYGKKGSGIVYCFSRKECEQVAEELCKRGISAAYYHADMETAARSSIHHRWSSNKLQVIVGTVAFGMGINKPDVRFVIHHSMSKSLETYYQESGRAGRDGLPSHCLLFYRPADLPRHSSMVFYEHTGLQNLYSMVHFCKSKRACRRSSFFNHFGEGLQECNGMCDNCAVGGDISDMDITGHAIAIVETVRDLDNSDKKITMLQLVDLFKSHSNKADPSLFKNLKKEQLEHIIVQLILDGILKETFQHTAYSTNAYVTLGPVFQSIMNRKRKVTLEVKQEVQANKSDRIHVGKALQDILDSRLARILDSLREELAQKYNEVYPYAILSSQQIAQLCVQKPSSIAQIQELLGKRKAEQFGREILETIRTHTTKDPDSQVKSGSWVSPKGSTLTQSSEVRHDESAGSSAASKKWQRANKKRKLDELICIQDTDSDGDDP